MKEHLQYKGFKGSIEPQEEGGSFYGKLLCIRDLVTYEARTLPELEKEFQKSVDGYLEDCARLGRNADKPL